MKVCPAPGCPTLFTAGRCAVHRREYEQQRGSRQERGYDAYHDRPAPSGSRSSQRVTCAAGDATT